MTEEELIREAKKRYPVGTLIRTATCNNEFTINTDYFEEISPYIKNTKRNDRKTPCVYHFPTKKWAEIISYPEGYNPEQNLLKELVIW